MNRPIRPNLKFIATLPTLKIQEEIAYKNTITWKIKLEKQINILHAACPALDTFYVQAVNVNSNVTISIKKNKRDRTWFIIEPHEEDWYVKNKWWEWAD